MNPTHWINIGFLSSANDAEAHSELLSSLGATSVSFYDPFDNTPDEQAIFEPTPQTAPIWQHARIVGLFQATDNIKNIETILSQELPGQQFDINPLEDKDWVRAWEEHFHPMCFGKQLWVCPSTKTPVEAHAKNIILDPGVAFGTGTHPTTALCLQWLDQNPPIHQQVLDFGCGSGILAIGAAMLGADHVDCVDHCEQALISTQDNATRNQVQSQLSIYLPADFNHHIINLKNNYNYNLILANILANPLIQLAPQFTTLVKPGGKIVLSGLLDEQITLVKQAYIHHFDFNTPDTIKDGWACLVGTKRE